MATTPEKTAARWLILAAGTILQLCLGTVYAWSYFQKPLTENYHWTNSQVILVFSLAICCLGLAAAWGGVQLPRFGPRRLGVAGGLLFGLGYLVAAAALRCRSLPLFYLGYGVVGGCGLGLCYVTPVATVAKWFPDRKGLATGIVIMGFGLGAFLMSIYLAPGLVHLTGGNLVAVFSWLGLGLGGASVLVALLLRNPPAGHAAGAAAAEEAGREKGDSPHLPERPATNLRSVPGCAQMGTVPFFPPLAKLIVSWRFALIWSIFFCNIIAGISIISFQSPLFQDLWKSLQPALDADTLAARGATLIAVSSLFNGLGRMFWGGLSDRLGRLPTFRVMLLGQIAAFALLATTGRPWLFGALVCYVLLCYGGGFGTMPALVLDTFGARRMAAVYGIALTAWSAGGIAGPQLVAFLKDHCGHAAGTYSFLAALGFVTLGSVLSLLVAGTPVSKPAPSCESPLPAIITE
jgi:OFA family oxalate/formate antiporter-like MFS transporter